MPLGVPITSTQCNGCKLQPRAGTPRVKSMWYKVPKKKRFCFWLSIFSCFAKRKNITAELRRNFQLINWLSKKEQKQKGNGAHRRPQCQKQPPNCSEGTSKQLANCGFPIELHALKKPRALFTAIWRAACFAYSMLQGLMNPCYSDFVRSCQFHLGPQWKALVSTKNLTLSILLEFQAAFYWEDLVTVTETA